jgi:hypothetical protein
MTSNTSRERKVAEVFLECKDFEISARETSTWVGIFKKYLSRESAKN